MELARKARTPKAKSITSLRQGCRLLFGSLWSSGKNRNKNAGLMDDVRASKHIYKPAFLYTILIRSCPFERPFLSSPSEDRSTVIIM